MFEFFKLAFGATLGYAVASVGVLLVIALIVGIVLGSAYLYDKLHRKFRKRKYGKE